MPIIKWLVCLIDNNKNKTGMSSPTWHVHGMFNERSLIKCKICQKFLVFANLTESYIVYVILSTTL